MNTKQKIILFLFFVLSLWLTKANSVFVSQAAAGLNVTILSPADNAVLPSAGYPQFYIVAQTNMPATCNYSTKAAAYSAMAIMTKSGNRTSHSQHVQPTAAGNYTYYIQCQASDGTLSNVASVALKVDKTIVDTPSNLLALGVSTKEVLLNWGQITNSTGYKLYRRTAAQQTAQLVASPSQWSGGTYADMTVSPDSVYYYSVSSVGASGEGPKTPEAAVITVPATTNGNSAPIITLDNFESGALKVVNTGNTPSPYFWYEDYGGDLTGNYFTDGHISVTSETSLDGTYSLKDALTGIVPNPPPPGISANAKPGSANLWFRTITDGNNTCNNLKDLIQSGTWQNDTYNRMVFWIKVPPEFGSLYTPGKGYTNMDIGTYVRATNGARGGGAGCEDGGNHFYHRYNIPYTGVWQEVIMDTHPTHIRGGSGGMEWGDQPYPTGEAGLNYFDELTSFYLGFAQGQSLSGYPANFYFDDFQIYKDTNAENVDQVFSLTGSYDPSSKQLYVGWSHPKDDATTKHEVRYSFQDIYSLPGATPLAKWNQATQAPGGIISPPSSAYDTMEYTTKAINVGSNPTIYIAIKPQGASTFSQISLPLNGSGPASAPPPVSTPTPPTAPTVNPPPVQTPTQTPTPVVTQPVVTTNIRIGQLVYNPADRTIYLIGPKGVYGFPNAATFYSWNYNFSQVVVENSDELNLPVAGVITSKQGNCTDALQLVNNLCNTAAPSAIRVGQAVFNPADRTVYLVDGDGVHGFPNAGVFYSWGYSFSQVVTENSTELQLPMLDVVPIKNANCASPLDQIKGLCN